MRAKKSLLVEYLLLGFVILWSGGYATYSLFPNWPYVIVALSLLVLYKRGLKLEPQHFIVISLFALVALSQAIVFSGPITSVIQPTFRLLAIAMVAVIVQPNMKRVFINITAFLALFALVFWLIDLIPAGHQWLLSVANGLPQLGAETLNESMIGRYGYVNHSLYFYTVSGEDVDLVGSLCRNCGPFYEPGRFAIPLCIALAMILFTESVKKYRTHFFIILIAILSTMSTTGYLVMLTLFAGYSMGRSSSNALYNFALLLLVIFAAFYLESLSFMGAKISDALGNTDVANSRFGAIFYHLPQIGESPWIGYGPFLSKVFRDLEMSPCGITDMMRIWGIPLFVFSVTLLFQGSRSLFAEKKAFRTIFVICLLYMAYTQTIMFDPIFLLLYFIGVRNSKLTSNTSIIENEFDTLTRK